MQKKCISGLNNKITEYFANGSRQAISVKPNIDFTLTIDFDNGEKRILDCKPFLKDNTVFETFKIYENFKRAYIDDTNSIAWDIDPEIDSNKVWSNKVDISVDNCYLESKPAR